jgi:hypothetical protein
MGCSLSGVAPNSRSQSRNSSILSTMLVSVMPVTLQVDGQYASCKRIVSHPNLSVVFKLPFSDAPSLCSYIVLSCLLILDAKWWCVACSFPYVATHVGVDSKVLTLVIMQFPWDSEVSEEVGHQMVHHCWCLSFRDGVNLWPLVEAVHSNQEVSTSPLAPWRSFCNVCGDPLKQHPNVIW